MSALLPIIDQLHRASDDRERARLLLSCPDGTLLKYADIFAMACQRVRFEAGWELVTLRVAAAQAVRDEAGLLPAELAGRLEALRAAMARFVAGPAPPSPTDL